VLALDAQVLLHHWSVLRGACVVHAGEGYRKRGSDCRRTGATLACMVTDDQLSELVALVARWALGAKYRIATAESCTGGWIAKAFTDAAGSSRWFESGYVTYSNGAKVRDLAVSLRTLKEHGAVSEPTVREMAAGALRVTGADVSIAVSGIAGPDGGSAEKPVGTVWFCVGRRVDSAAGASGGTAGGAGRPDVELVSEGEVFGGDREAVRRAAVRRALELVLQFEKRG
jgi:nicotinamide-nucleotide amidase